VFAPAYGREARERADLVKVVYRVDIARAPALLEDRDVVPGLTGRCDESVCLLTLKSQWKDRFWEDCAV
jgi:hypothetical protein